jgi:hypothetical protein
MNAMITSFEVDPEVNGTPMEPPFQPVFRFPQKKSDVAQVFETGNEHGPNSGFGQVVLTFGQV